MGAMFGSARGALGIDELEEVVEAALRVNASEDTCSRATTALRKRLHSVELLAGLGRVCRRRAVAVESPPNRSLVALSDACTQPSPVLDVATAAALLVAACDGTTAHHGFSPPREGGAALLEALGFSTSLRPREAHAALDWSGFAFLPAALYHPDLPRLTALLPDPEALLPLLSPLANPAFPEHQVVLVDRPAVAETIARALGELGAERVLVVATQGHPCLGALGPVVGVRWEYGRISRFNHPGLGLSPDTLASAGPEQDAERIRRLFARGTDPLSEAIALHAGAALWIGEVLPTLETGRAWARDRLAQGIDLAELRGPG